jgi:N-acylneuraminate cytidylyltransferase
MKKFNTRDAKGMELVREEGIIVALLTAERSEIVTARAQKLQIEYVFLGIKDKLPFLEEFCSKMGITFSEIAYIGDDVNDLPVLEKVGFSACPNDAVPLVKEKTFYSCKKKGGNGAVREICDLILRGKFKT